MPALSDRLKALGVKLGTQDIKPHKNRPEEYLDSVLGGERQTTPIGDTYVVNTYYPSGYQHGWHTFPVTPPLQGLALWVKDQRVSNLPINSFAFLDTETTGLSGGTGTYAFLIGLGKFEGDTFHLAQFFMRDPSEEPAQLAALEDFLASVQALVTFNGKSFDIPLLTTRFHYHGWRPPFQDLAHVDLLHLARRLWRETLSSRTLSNLEVHILGTDRTSEDIPGWMIPQIYFDYLRSSDPTQLRNVFYHNRLDVVSLVALLEHSAQILVDPGSVTNPDSVDLVALARLYDDYGQDQEAIRYFKLAISKTIIGPRYVEALMRLAAIYKRQGESDAAISLWVQAAENNELVACVELAKLYEHRLRDIPSATLWTEKALILLETAPFSSIQRDQYRVELNHRLERLLTKGSW